MKLTKLCSHPIPLLALLILFSAGNATGQVLKHIDKKEKGHPKIESVLTELQDEYEKGLGAGEEFAKKRLLKVKDKDKITVFIMAGIDKTSDDIDQAALAAEGAEIIKTSGGMIKAVVPIKSIKRIAEAVGGISFIRVPDKPQPRVYLSEGVSLSDATSYYSSGHIGIGAKVGIIDSGFSGISSAISNGDLPPDNIHVLDCTGLSCMSVPSPWNLPGSSGHGTAVAEIVHDMAPGADLYLLRIDDPLDLVDAKNFCINAGIKIINYSGGWVNTNFYDGTCYPTLVNPVCTVNNAYANGILWVNAVGNDAKRHYESTYFDLNLDGAHDQLISFTGTEGYPAVLSLTWNAWPATNQDYDLYLFDSIGVLVAGSATFQTGAQPPTEEISTILPYDDIYTVVVVKYSATSNHKFELFSWPVDITPTQPTGSTSTPEDAVGAFAVGAIDYQNWFTGPIANYSSQGPTNDGRAKPEIVGPSSVSTFTYAPAKPGGTSFSAPHVAGAAALILSANPTFTVEQLWDTLTSSAIDMGVPGMDNVFGVGRLALPSLFDSFGVFRSGSWYLDYSMNAAWSGCGLDACYSFGLPTDIPLVGGWNGKGRAKIGVFRNGTWILDMNGNGRWDGPVVDWMFSFGLPNDKPVAGDWNGDGITEVGVFRNGTWILDYNGNGAWNPGVDKVFVFGLATDIPITGDWNGDGKTEVGVFRNGAWILDYDGNFGWNGSVDKVANFGLPTDRPVAGDWNADGRTEIGVYRSGLWVLDLNGNLAWNSGIDKVFSFGIAADRPLAGNW